MKRKFQYLFVWLVLIFVQLFIPPSFAGKKNLYIGTGGKNAEGIYRAVFDQSSGHFSDLILAAKIGTPGFLAFHPQKNILYAVARWPKQAGVIGYKISETGDLDEFTRIACSDGMGCHLSVHPSGKFLLTAQYGSGSVGFFPLDKEGRLLEAVIHKHSGGSKVFQNRQNSPHPHWCGYSPCGNFALVPDLGLDRIVIYKIHQDHTKITVHTEAHCFPGGGPRHMKFSPNEKYIYLLNELSLAVESFFWNSHSGRATSLFTVPTLSDREKEAETFNSAAEILVHPSGKWVYSSNRGHDSVTVFEAKEDGSLRVIQKQPIRGAFPRNINFSPNGQWLLAAGQDSNTISAHRIDSKSGKLTYQKGSVINAPNPICLIFPNKIFSQKNQ